MLAIFPKDKRVLGTIVSELGWHFWHQSWQWLYCALAPQPHQLKIFSVYFTSPSDWMDISDSPLNDMPAVHICDLESPSDLRSTLRHSTWVTLQVHLVSSRRSALMCMELWTDLWTYWCYCSVSFFCNVRIRPNYFYLVQNIGIVVKLSL